MRFNYFKSALTTASFVTHPSPARSGRVQWPGREPDGRGLYRYAT